MTNPFVSPNVRIPDPETDLSDAASRGCVRQQSAAADRCLALLADLATLMHEEKIGDEDDLARLQDTMSSVRHHRDALDEAVAVAMQISDSRAPRRPGQDLISRIA